MIRETKEYFETLFFNEWTKTPIHFAGQEDLTPKPPMWVAPYYEPSRTEASGMSIYSAVHYGSLLVACWGDDEGEAMLLADDIATFIHSEVDRSLVKIKFGYSILDHGWDASNKVYVLVSFNVSVRCGTCTDGVFGCDLSIGSGDGTKWLLDGNWLKNCIIFKEKPGTTNLLYDGAEQLFDGTEELKD